MAPKSSKSKRKGGSKRRVARMGRWRRKTYNVPEYASCSEVQSIALQNTGTVYQNYKLDLAGHVRASTIAKGYQFFRIKSVKYTLKPLQDTFNGAGTSIPHLYWMIDRTGSLRAVTNADTLKKLGARPHRMDDKLVHFSYRPSVVNSAADATAGADLFVQYKMTPWLPTRESNTLVWNANTTDHFGVIYIVENVGGQTIQYAVEREVQFEFKKPSFQVTTNMVDPPAEEEVVIYGAGL